MNVRAISLLPALLLALPLASCVNRMHWSERAAQDRIMLVRETPPTLGFRRLSHQSVAHPDLGLFLSRKGSPDFIAETSAEDRQYLVLYYLNLQSAFACRSWRGQPDMIEFAGPYRISDKETEILTELKSNASGSSSSGIAAGRLLIP